MIKSPTAGFLCKLQSLSIIKNNCSATDIHTKCTEMWIKFLEYCYQYITTPSTLTFHIQRQKIKQGSSGIHIAMKSKTKDPVTVTPSSKEKGTRHKCVKAHINGSDDNSEWFAASWSLVMYDNGNPQMLCII